MKMYRVNVNGNLYEITLEVVDKANVAPAAAPAPAATPAPTPVAAPAPAPAAAPAAAGSESITAPMPGTILAVNVTNGAAVKKGDVLFILEAMKMENEIMAPRDGVITSVVSSKGAAVENGTPLVYLA